MIKNKVECKYSLMNINELIKIVPTRLCGTIFFINLKRTFTVVHALLTGVCPTDNIIIDRTDRTVQKYVPVRVIQENAFHSIRPRQTRIFLLFTTVISIGKNQWTQSSKPRLRKDDCRLWVRLEGIYAGRASVFPIFSNLLLWGVEEAKKKSVMEWSAKEEE